MKANNEERDLWRISWLSSIKELTSIDLQNRSWLDKANTNSHWTFVEFICSYFDDLAIDDNYEEPLKNGWISMQEYEIVKEWHYALAKYETPNNIEHDHKAILSDPEWLQIIEIGTRMKLRLAAMLSNEERMILV